MKTKQDNREIKVKTLKWKEVKPEVFENWSFNAEIKVLTLNGRPAYYQVASVSNDISATFWHGNMADTIKDGISLEEGEEVCQKHFNNLILSNIDL